MCVCVCVCIWVSDLATLQDYCGVCVCVCVLVCLTSEFRGRQVGGGDAVREEGKVAPGGVFVVQAVVNVDLVLAKSLDVHAAHGLCFCVFYVCICVFVRDLKDGSKDLGCEFTLRQPDLQ